MQLPAFTSSNRVIALDLPGHGKSDAPADGKYTMNLFASMIDAVRIAEGFNQAVLIGHSMGAIVIRQYALNYPGRVAGLVAADGPLDVRPFSRLGKQQPMTLAMRAATIDGMFVSETAETLRSEICNLMLGTPEEAANGTGSAMYDLANQSERKITAPALTIYAGTPYFSRNPMTWEMLPNWQSTHIPGTGHFLMMEKPEEFNRICATFIQRTTPSFI
jgi:pimeloyl-ACP methyl ester carboxylesterase